MKISYRWLADYLPVELPPSEMAEILTRIGLEVESLDEWASVRGGLAGLVIGEVKEVSKHPNADKLSLTKVSIGNGALLSIVCGAPNVAAGQKVVVAPVNTTIHPAEGPPLMIQKAKIRGEESQGMICAEDEIGLGQEHAGIIVLDPAAPVGGSAAEHLGVVRDWIFDIAVTPNRADAMSHIGVSRDIAAYLSYHRGERIPLKPLDSGKFVQQQESSVEIVVEDDAACPRYSGLTASGVVVGPSPAWIQNRLKAIDVRPINNVVDVTNYVLHELGQPLHAFDADEIRGNKVIVKTLGGGTPFTTLDEQERSLSSEDLMICDATGGMCIAGVFGGVRSGVSGKTRRIFLESAHFNPVSVRKTSFRHNLRTEAAMRFEKGTDPNVTITALERAGHLLREAAPEVAFSRIVDAYPRPIGPKMVTASFHVMDRLIGAAVASRNAKPILQALGMNAEATHDSIRVEVPTWKRDIEHAADLVEEVLRIYGMDRIETSTRFVTGVAEESSHGHKMQRQAAGWLAANGFREMHSLSMCSAMHYDAQTEPVVKLLNPLSSELEVMRGSLLYSGLEHVAHNINHRSLDLKLFEFGRVYPRRGSSFTEEERLSIFMTGAIAPETWEQPRRPVNFFGVKTVAQRVLQLLGLAWEEREISDGHFEQVTALQASGTVAGIFGEISAKLLSRFDIRQPVFAADLSWTTCLALSAPAATRFKALPRFPSIRRDLAIVVDEAVTYAEIHKVATSKAGGLLRDVRLFDTYRDEKIGRGRKSYAMAFMFRDDSRTLTDQDADKAIAGIIESLEKNLSAAIRTS
jgi:phenylalanyl-tRNA synthetase beta chain